MIARSKAIEELSQSNYFFERHGKKHDVYYNEALGKKNHVETSRFQRKRSPIHQEGDSKQPSGLSVLGLRPPSISHIERSIYALYLFRSNYPTR